MNRLFYGDNLHVLRESIVNESVDLIYLDPPFNSKRDYNVLFKSPKGQSSDAQIVAFEDSWHWGMQAEQEFSEILASRNTDVSQVMAALRQLLGENDVMAYLTMMANRLLELHRVLKATGSLYLHCDPTASHYLKLVLDAVFGKENFRNEIIWQRALVKGDAREKYGTLHDTLFFFTKSNDYVLQIPRRPPDAEYLSRFGHDDGDGRGRYHSAPLDSPNPRPNLTYSYKGFDPPEKGWRVDLEEMKRLDAVGRLIFPKNADGRIRRKLFLSDAPGAPVGDVWTDIPAIGASQHERLGYPTQKPLGLLDRIIEASSNPGDVLLDPFCGCGTAIHSAQRLDRQWIGIDITHLAISLIEKRLRDAFPKIVFEVAGTPTDYAGARDLALRDKYQFQWWACSLVDAQPFQGKKKGADGGIDGIIFFQDEKSNAKRIVVSVKGGENVGVAMVKDLIATVQREKAQIGLFVTLVPATKPMKTEAASAGFYDSPTGGSFPRIQILTIEGLIDGIERPQYPFVNGGGMSFKRGKVEFKSARQVGMFDA